MQDRTKKCSSKDCLKYGKQQEIEKYRVVNEKTGKRDPMCKPCRQRIDRDRKSNKNKGMQEKEVVILKHLRTKWVA